MLYTWNEYNIVNQLYFNKKKEWLFTSIICLFTLNAPFSEAMASRSQLLSLQWPLRFPCWSWRTFWGPPSSPLPGSVGFGLPIKEQQEIGKLLSFAFTGFDVGPLCRGHSQPIRRHSGSNRMRLSDNTVFTFCQNQAHQLSSYHAVNRYLEEPWLFLGKYQDELFILVSPVLPPNQ